MEYEKATVRPGGGGGPGFFGLSLGTTLAGIGVLLLVVCGCGVSTTTLKFRDSKGAPLKDVLVLSEQTPYMFQDWAVAAYISDQDGHARTIKYGRKFAFKPGYYPAFDDSLSWASWSTDDDGAFVLHPMVHPGRPECEFANKSVDLIGDDVVVYSDPALGLRVTIDGDGENLKVSSGNDLRPSEGFYFVGVSGNAEPAHLLASRNEGELYFYLDALGRRRKFGFRVGGAGDRAVEGGRVDVVWVSMASSVLESPDQIVEPPSLTDKGTWQLERGDEIGSRELVYRSDVSLPEMRAILQKYIPTLDENPGREQLLQDMKRVLDEAARTGWKP